jgi:hypothetical protein
LHAKSVAGVAWTLLPAPMRRNMNKLLSAITKPRGVSAYVEDYR